MYVPRLSAGMQNVQYAPASVTSLRAKCTQSNPKIRHRDVTGRAKHQPYLNIPQCGAHYPGRQGMAFPSTSAADAHKGSSFSTCNAGIAGLQFSTSPSGGQLRAASRSFLLRLYHGMFSMISASMQRDSTISATTEVYLF